MLFTHPTYTAMKPCSFFLDGACKFDDGTCKFSHGHVVPFSDLRPYREPDFRWAWRDGGWVGWEGDLKCKSSSAHQLSGKRVREVHVSHSLAYIFIYINFHSNFYKLRFHDLYYTQCSPEAHYFHFLQLGSHWGQVSGQAHRRSLASCHHQVWVSD